MCLMRTTSAAHALKPEFCRRIFAELAATACMPAWDFCTARKLLVLAGAGLQHQQLVDLAAPLLHSINSIQSFVLASCALAIAGKRLVLQACTSITSW
jgi:hypothetical protein